CEGSDPGPVLALGLFDAGRELGLGARVRPAQVVDGRVHDAGVQQVLAGARHAREAHGVFGDLQCVVEFAEHLVEPHLLELRRATALTGDLDEPVVCGRTVDDLLQGFLVVSLDEAHADPLSSSCRCLSCLLPPSGCLRHADQRSKSDSEGFGEAVESASCEGRAPPMNCSTSRPSATFAGWGPAAMRRGSHSVGSGDAEAANTRLPKRRPLSTCTSARIARCGSTCFTVAACRRANCSPDPSATFTSRMPVGFSSAAASW